MTVKLFSVKRQRACQMEDVYAVQVGLEATMFMLVLQPAVTQQVWWWVLFTTTLKENYCLLYQCPYFAYSKKLHRKPL